MSKYTHDVVSGTWAPSGCYPVGDAPEGYLKVRLWNGLVRDILETDIEERHVSNPKRNY